MEKMHCKICLLVINSEFEIIQKHHLIPKVMHGISKIENLDDTIDLCPNCHEIAHIIIKNAIIKNPFVRFWDVEELIKAGRKFRRENLRKLGKY